MPRHFKRKFYGPRAVIQSYKKVLNDAPASRLAATTISLNIAKGVDSLAAGQTGPIDADVPTGCVIKYIEIEWAFMNLLSAGNFIHSTIQKLRANQAPVSPNVVGGNPQRNQVFHQTFRSAGFNQNGNMVLKFKVPKSFQRMREGDVWQFNRIGTGVFSDGLQIIYKFYR